MTDVLAPATFVRRRLYLLRDLADGRGDAVWSALSAHDLAAEYRVVISLSQSQPDWVAATGLLFFVTQEVAQGPSTLFTQARAFLSEFGPVPIALITDSDDARFLKSCYAHGISQVLQTTLSMSVIVHSLQLIAHGRAFVPVRLLRSAPLNEL